MPLHAQAWREAARWARVPVTVREIYAWEGEPGLVTARRLLRRAGRAPTTAAASALLHEKEQRFSQSARRIRVDRETGAVVRALAARGVPMALVTGTSSRELARMLPRALRHVFRAVVTGDRVHRGKPHPESYRTAFRALGLRPRGAVVVENAPNGIRSARRARAGLVIALTSSLPARYLREAHVIVPTARKLRDELMRRLTLPQSDRYNTKVDGLRHPTHKERA